MQGKERVGSKPTAQDFLDTAVGYATATPDPVGDAGLPIWDLIKGYSAAKKQGKSVPERIQAGRRNFIGEESTGLGEILPTDNKDIQTIGNLAEIPLTLFVAGKINAKATAKEMPDIFQNLAKQAKNEDEYATMVKAIMNDPKYEVFAKRVTESGIDPMKIFRTVRGEVESTK